MYKYLITCVIFITLITLNGINSKQISNIARQKYNSELKLFDMGQELLPNINTNKSIIKNAIPLLLIMYSCIFMKYKLHKILICICVMIFLRMIANRVTILPRSDDTCELNQSFDGGCNELMFSGHTALTVLLCLFIYEDKSFMKYVLIMLSLMQMCIMVSTKAHYTVDVYIGTLVAMLIFTNKHMFTYK